MANIRVNNMNSTLFGTDVSKSKLHETQILTLPDIYDNKIANAQGVKMVNDHEASSVSDENISETEKKVPVINSGPILNGQVQEGSNRNKTNPAQIKNKQNKHELRFKVWNIHGLKQSKLSKIINKSDKFFNDIFKKSDFVIFTETWSENGDGELFTWDDDNFEEIIRKNGQRTSRRGRSSGGISFSARKNLAQGYDILSADSYRIWCRFHKIFFGWEQDIVVCFLYILPSDSNW